MVFFCFWVVRFDFNKILNAFTDLIPENIDDTKTDVLELTPLIQWKILLLYLYSESHYWIQYLFKFIMFKRLIFTLTKITNYSVFSYKKSVDCCAFCSKSLNEWLNVHNPCDLFLLHNTTNKSNWVDLVPLTLGSIYLLQYILLTKPVL